MKKTLYLIFMFVLASCAKTDLDDASKDGRLVLSAENPTAGIQVRTSCTGLTPFWSVGDMIGVCQLSDSSNEPFKADITESAPSASFVGQRGQSGACVAYYPYKASARNNDVLSLEIASRQYPGTSSFDGDSDLLVSSQFDLAEDASEGPAIKFNRLTAVLKVVLRDKTAKTAITGLKIDSLKVSFPENMAGTVAVGLSGGAIGDLTGNVSKVVTAVHTDGNKYAIDGSSASYINVYPKDIPENAAMRVEAWAGALHISKDTVMSEEGLRLDGGSVATLFVDISDAHVAVEAKPIEVVREFAPPVLPAGTVTISSQSEFNGLGLHSATKRPGTVVVVKNGTYHDFRAWICASGTDSAPIVIRAETPGGVKLTGSSYFFIEGSYVHLSGFEFKDIDFETWEEGKYSQITTFQNSHHCQISQCKFNYEGAASDATIQVSDIRLYGSDHKVMYCTFLDKKVLAPQVQCQPADPPYAGEHLRDTIVHCYFTRPTVLYKDTGEVLNGQESILAGLSRFSQKASDIYIARNWFYRSDGEHSEVVSIKGCNNIVEENLFQDCYGNLSLRHGKFNTVRRNFLIGTDTSLEEINGICVFDTDNTIESNYLHGLPDKTWFAPICLMAGDVAPERSESDPAVLKSFWQVRNALIKDNVVRNCGTGITLAMGKSSYRHFLPQDCMITGNIAYNCTNPVYYYLENQDPAGHVWTNNFYSGGTFHYNVWGLKHTDVNYVFPDTVYEQSMSKIKNKAGVTW